MAYLIDTWRSDKCNSSSEAVSNSTTRQLRPNNGLQATRNSGAALAVAGA